MKFLRALIIGILCEGLFSSVGWAAAEQAELRIPLTLAGYRQMEHALADETIHGRPRTDHYFDLLLDGALALRHTELPTKIRIKDKGRGEYMWQVSKRESRDTRAVNGIPVTFTKFEIYEESLDPKLARAVIAPSQDFLSAMLQGESTAKGYYRRFARGLGFLDGVAGTEIINPLIQQGAKLVPILVNTKQRLYLEPMKIGGYKMEIFVGWVTYWNSENEGWRSFEMEAEIDPDLSPKESVEAMNAFATYVKEVGLKKSHIETESPDHCARVVKGLRALRI